MLEVKWKVALYVDERANQDQRDALTQIFSGQASGHLASVAPLIGEVLAHLSLLAGSVTRESAPELNRGQKVCTTAGMF